MRVLFLAFLLFGPGAWSFVYNKENRYSHFLKKYTDLRPPSVSGFNIKVQEESLDGLVGKLRAQLEQDGLDDEDVDKALFEFEDEDDFDDFQDIDVTDMDPHDFEPELIPSEPVDAVVTATVGKWSASYSRVFSITANKTKSFWKVHDTAREGGKVKTNVKGSLDTKVTSTTTGSADAGVNTTVYMKGKEYKIKVGVHSNIKGNGTEMKAGKKGGKIVSLSASNVDSTIKVDGKSYPLRVAVKSGAETFLAPFKIFVTLFGSEVEVTANGQKSNGKVRGEVTSRVIFDDKKGKTLTKATIRGFVLVEGKDVCSAKMFKIKSHVWTKPAKKSEQMEDSSSIYDSEAFTTSEEPSPANAIVVNVYTYSRGRVYERTNVAKQVSVFAGSGAVAFEMDKLTIPTQSVGTSQYGKDWLIKNLLEHKLANWVQPSTGMMGS